MNGILRNTSTGDTYSTREVVRLLKQYYSSTRSIYEKLGQLRRGYTRRWTRRDGKRVVREYNPLLHENQHYVRDGSEIYYTPRGVEVIMKTVKKKGEGRRAEGKDEGSGW